MSELVYYASGKLLLFGEYLVLRGAKSLAIPLRFGQSLSVSPLNSELISWKCFENKELWLDITFSPSLEIIRTSDEQSALMVKNILSIIEEKNPSLKIRKGGLQFRFDIDFNRNYGLGTSSTLISLLSQWSGVNPYFLLDNSFKGSGFDIAVATAPQPIIYTTTGLSDNAVRSISPIHLNPGITSQILFVYTGKKQKSQSEVISFKNKPTTPEDNQDMNTIVESVAQCTNIEAFETLMNKSENLLSAILQTPEVKQTLFPDYPFAIKSLGAWGGDFVMGTFREETEAKKYFSDKGMSPIFNYHQIIKND